MYVLRINSKDITDDVLMKIAIYPTAVLDETYMFVLKLDRTLEVSIGTRKSFDSDIFMKKEIDTKQKKLTVEESEALLDAVDRMAEDSDNFRKIMVMDGWAVSIYHNGKIIHLNYTGNKSVDLEIIINELIRISPIYVDLHGWS